MAHHFLLSGGGMKVSYQIGQVAGLLDRGVEPASITAVSSGILTAALLRRFHRTGDGDRLLNTYAGTLRRMASRGKLPPVPVCRAVAADRMAESLDAARVPGPKLVFLGAERESYAPLLIEPVPATRPEVFVALMSLRFVLESEASRDLGILDGGYVSNTPTWGAANAPGEPVVLAHFRPAPTRPASAAEFWEARRRLRRVLGNHLSRAVWAWCNSTWPAMGQGTAGRWLHPQTPCGLTFFSRRLDTHLRALQSGRRDAHAALAAGRVPSATAIVSTHEVG